jgi:hypothetical protein
MSGAKQQQSEPAEKTAKPDAGRRRPPVEYQFKKGISGNPSGRPPKPKTPATLAGIDKILLEEAYRPVRLSEGGETIVLPAIQAAVRALGVRAIKGDRHSQLALTNMVAAAEARRDSGRQTLTRDEASGLKEIMERIAVNPRSAPNE